MNRILLRQSAAGRQGLKRVLAACALAALVVSGPCLHAATPDLQNSIPRGAQRGVETKVTFTGNRLGTAEEVLFHHPGITAKDVKVIDNRKVEATLVVAPDCRLGEHHVRLRCKDGITYARNFWISQFPTVAEKEPNDLFDQAQPIDLNVTVEGEAKPEETDYYRIQAKKGQRISVEMEALRINNIRNNIAIDPYVAILNKDRFEIASADGSALLKQESIVSVVVPEDGEYTVEVRDSAYQGRGRYRAHIGVFPRPTALYPLGGKAGSEVEFTVLGDPLGTYTFKEKLPAALDVSQDTHPVFAGRDGVLPPSPNPVRVSPFDNVLEAEPNNNYKEATEGGALPRAFNGILAIEGDEDYFKFTAKKGERYRIRVFARQLGSPVDPVIYVYDGKMKGLGSSDDADGTKDGRVDFNAPADGDYYVRVRDMLLRGGPDFVYRIESEKSVPKIELTMPEMQRRDLQYRKQMNVPRGNRYAMVVNVRRSGFSGEVKLDVPALPQGVTLETPPVPNGVNQVPVLFRAAPDAPVAGMMSELKVASTDPEKPLEGEFIQSLDFVRGPQNGVEYYTRYVSQIPVAVTEEAPFSISIDQPKVPIVRNGTMKMKVRVERKDGYDKKIVARMLWRPPGISCPSTVTFNEKDTEVEYELNANATAALGNWKICVIADSTTDKGPVTVSSPYIDLNVEEPFVNMKLSMATAKQGENVPMLGEVEALREFDGQADVQLFGLPARATTEVLKIDKSAGKIQFPVVVDEQTPVGQHKNLFCTVVVQQNGEPIVHRVGMGGVIRVDPKPKEAPPKPAATVAKKEPKKPAEKPLSRLEQLRLEAKNEAAAP